MSKFIICLALLIALPAASEDYRAIVEEAFANVSDDYHQAWAFTETTTEEEATVIGRYNPSFPNDVRWQLLSVDGRDPTTEEIADYRDDKEDEFQEDNDDGDLEVVNFDTLSLIEKTDKYWIFGFVPQSGDEEDETAEKFLKKVSGTLKVARNGNNLVYFDLNNEKPIRPAFGVKISRFLTHLDFGPAGGDGPIVPMGMDVVVRGRAMLAIKIDESESIRYSDYEYVGT